MKNSFCYACNLQFDTALFYTHHLSVVHKIEIKKESVGSEVEVKTNNYDNFETVLEFKEFEIKKEPIGIEEEEKTYISDNFSELRCISNIHERKQIPILTSEPLKKQPNTGKFECQVCNANFVQRGHLNRHKINHEKKKPHKCSLCNASFPRNDTLTKHFKAVHEKKRPFKCGICKASFTQRSNVNKHIASVHENKRPFRCELCHQSFTQKAHLKKHISCIHDKQNCEALQY